MHNFRLPRSHSTLYEYVNKNSIVVDNRLLNIGTRNYYIDNITEQTKLFNEHWDTLIRIYHPYEFISEITQLGNFFTHKYATHVELVQFLNSSNSKLYNKVSETQRMDNNQHSIKTLCFYGSDKDNLNKMDYINNNNQNNLHMCVEYTSTNIDKLLSNNMSSIDYINVGSHSYNDDEEEYARTSYVCVLYTLCFQKRNGSAIIKMFNIDSILSIGIITLLTSMYQEVHIVKPITSYIHSSEVFIVCKFFLPLNSKCFYTKFINIIKKLPQINYTYDVLDCHIVNLLLLNKINEISMFFYQRRLENLHTILNSSILQMLNDKKDLITDLKPKTHLIIKNNVQKCIQWLCQYKAQPLRMNSSTELNKLVNNIIMNNF